MSVQKVLSVVSSLEYGSAAAQCVYLQLALDGREFHRQVCVTGRAGPWMARLRNAGIEVDVSGRGRLFDLKPIVQLRSLVRSFAPDVLHVWGLPALRIAALSGFRGRLVVCPCLGPEFMRPWLRRLDAWLLRRADCVLALSLAEASRCLRLGIPDSCLAVLSPVVTAQPATSAVETRRFLLCIGRLEQHKGFVDAVWAHDILRQVHPDLHLVIIGEGPERERLRRFSDGLQSAAFVHLPGEVPEVFSLLHLAEVVWSPGRTETGSQVILEAMAVGKPVVASRWPSLAELVEEGVTGFLVPPEDRAVLARQTQVLLSDAALREKMGAAARQRAETFFSPQVLAELCARLYKG